MPFPKIAAELNNCALHTVTPELKDEIIKLGGDERYENGHNESYGVLKDKFAGFYNIEPANFTWRNFANILERYNAHDVQIIMGPVLREFMKDVVRADDLTPTLAMLEGIDVAEYVKKITEINPLVGRYESLSSEQVSQYVGISLGLVIEYHKEGQPSRKFDVGNPLATVQMYHHGNIEGAGAGGHWERTHDAQDREDFSGASVLKTFTELLRKDHHELTDLVLDVLKIHVKFSAQAGVIEALAVDVDNKYSDWVVNGLVEADFRRLVNETQRKLVALDDREAAVAREESKNRFNLLIESIRSRNVSPGKQGVADSLYDSLKQASEHFFQEENYTQAGFERFEQVCAAAINTARPDLRDWGAFFKTLALTIVTAGVGFAVYNKVTKGTFSYSFFPDETEIDATLHELSSLRPRN